MKSNTAAAMNVQSRSKLGAFLTIIFIGNVYYFKPWRSDEILDAHLSSESNHQLKLIKLIVSPSGNCSLPSQWGHAFHYVIDPTTGMTSLFLQNPNPRVSRQDVNISILHMDPAGFVNSEILLQTYPISNYACKYPTNQMNSRMTRINSLQDEIEKLIKKIKRTNRTCQKYDLQQFKSLNRRNNYLIVASNCVQNLIDTFEESDIEEKRFNCRNNQTLHFQTLFKFLSGSQINSNSYISTAIDDQSNLSDFYYGKINLTHLKFVSHNRNHSLSNSKDNRTTSKLLTKPEVSNLTKNDKIGTDKITTSNYNKTYKGVIYSKFDIIPTNVSISKRNESINVSSDNTKEIITLEPLLNSERTLNIETAETITSNITDSDQKYKFSDVQKYKNKSTENINVISNIEKKHNQKGMLNGTLRNYEVNNPTLSNNKKEKESQSTKRRKSKTDQSKDKRFFFGKTNGLDTILIFKNLNEIDDLYDRTFSDPTMLKSSILNISNRADTVAENNKVTPIVESTQTIKNISTAFLLPKNQNDSGNNATNDNFMTTKNLSIPLIINFSDMKKNNNKIDVLDYYLKPNSATDMIASTSENYKINQSEATKIDDTIILKPFITLPAESIGNITVKHFLYETNTTRNDESNKNGSNETISVLMIKTAGAKKQPQIDLFRSLSKKSETTPIKPIEGTIKKPHVALFRNLSKESATTTIKPTVVKIINKTYAGIPFTSNEVVANDRLDYLTLDLKEDKKTINENRNNNQTRNKFTKLPIKSSFSNGTEVSMDTKPKDNIDENTRIVKKIFKPTTPSIHFNSDIHSELSKTSKLFDQSEVVHKKHNLYDNKPQINLFHSYANTMSSSNNNKHKGIGEFLINKYQADDNKGRSVIQGFNFAALVSPRDQFRQDLPYEKPSDINAPYKIVTYIPENDEYEYETGNVEAPPNIQTYKPIILNDSSFTTNSSENQNAETPTEKETTYDNEYPETTSNYDDYPQFTTTQQNSNPNLEYTDNYENTEFPKNNYPEVSTPKTLSTVESTKQPLLFSTEHFSKENDAVYNNGNSDSAIRTKNANFDNPDYSSNEGLKGNSMNLHSGETGDGFRDPEDSYNEDYSAYIEPSGPHSSVPVSTEDVPTKQPFFDIPPYHKITKPASLYSYSDEINNYYQPQKIYNNQAQQPHPQVHHNVSVGADPVLEKPIQLLNLDHHKVVTPISYMVYQNFLTRTNKLPPDKASTESFKSHHKPVPSYTKEIEGYSNVFPESEEQILLNENRDKKVGSTNKPSEETTISPQEVINNFLNSPINWKEFEQTPDFNVDKKFKSGEAPNHHKQGYQVEYTTKENIHPASYNTVSNPSLNKSTVNPNLSYSLNNTHHEVNVLKLPTFVETAGLGDSNSFQPLNLGHAPDFQSNRYLENNGITGTPYPWINKFNAIHFKSTIPSLSFNVDQRGPRTNLLSAFQNNLIDFNGLSQQKTNNLQPGKLIDFWDYHQPDIQKIPPTQSYTSKGIDIFIPKTKIKPITKSIDILTPGNSSSINIIKLKPLHHKSTQFHHVTEKPLEIDIFTRAKSNTQSMYSLVHPTKTVEPVFDTGNHQRQQLSPYMTALHFPYIPVFQPTFENTFKPLDLSMDAVYETSTITIPENSALFKNATSLGEHYINLSKETQRKAFTISEDPTNGLLNSTEANPGGHEEWRSSNFTEPAMISFERFNTEQEINSYLKYINRLYGHKVKVSTIGTTVEGRPIQAVRISMGGGGHNPVIVMDGGIHAREWIAPAVVLYVVQQLTERPEQFPLLRRVDWLLVPLLNPDGYVFSMTKDRLWRKNRARPKPTDTHRCYGVDLNRNFGVFRSRRQIDLDSRGASDDPCANNYRGVNPFSEPESRALRDLIWDHRSRVKLYASFHSYGNYLMLPWGYKRPHPNDWKDLDELATAARGAIFNATGTRYSIGSTADIMGVNSGGSDDWVKGYVGVKYCYTVELPGGGVHGFDLPPSRIRPVVEEMFEGIKVFAKFIEREFSP